MKYKVNDTCIACGLCAGTCPEVFRMNDETGMAEAYAEATEATNESAQDAMNSCPAVAIEEA